MTCEWPGCPQQTWTGHLCYFHDKVSLGLIDGRDAFPDGRQDQRQHRLVHALTVVGSSSQVVSLNAAPKPTSRSSVNDGGGIPQGRVVRA